MAKAKKLPSGNWRVQVFAGMENGKKKYKSFTASSRKEAEFQASEWALERKERQCGNITVKEAIDRYIEAKKGTLAPSTYREYLKAAERDLVSLHKVKLWDLTSEVVQAAISEESESHSPKTVRNMYGLLAAALKMFSPDISIHVELPKKKRKEVKVPTDKDVQTLLLHVKGKPIEGAILLAATGSLRRSEVSALMPEDVTDLSVQVSKAMVLDSTRKWVIKSPKTEAGYRFSALPPQVIEVVRRCIPFPNPNVITKQFEKACKECGVEGITFHRLRHYYASVLHFLGVPDQNIMLYGGWSSPQVLQGIYEHALEDKNPELRDKIVNHFEDVISHGISHEKSRIFPGFGAGFIGEYNTCRQ